MHDDDLLLADGVHARTGAYLVDPLAPTALADLAVRQVRGADKNINSVLGARAARDEQSPFAVAEGIDRGDLAQVGWGVIFPAVRPGGPEERALTAIREAMDPLLRRRRQQATLADERYYQEFHGHRGFRPGDTHHTFLGRHGVDPGAPADPEAMPYYLLIVGSPSEIPFSFQVQLDVTYAVGRIHFTTLDEYADYARSVVAAETDPPRRRRELAVFGVCNPDDQATRISRDHLVAPLADALAGNRRLPGWTVRRSFDEHADKATIGRLLGGDATPALLFTASHGLCFDRGDPMQIHRQGALICDEWKNPHPRAPVTEDMYFSGDDLAAAADLRGLVVFNFACYSGGTPALDTYARPGRAQDRRIAEQPFVSGLHRKLLAHPNGSALACIGHLERAWTHSLPMTGAMNRLGTFRSAMEVLMKGLPVGAALEYFGARYAQLGADMSSLLAELDHADPADADAARATLALRWTAHNDARDYVVAGDPAVRLRFAVGER